MEGNISAAARTRPAQQQYISEYIKYEARSTKNEDRGLARKVNGKEQKSKRQNKEQEKTWVTRKGGPIEL
jgi:hypothetical protein